MMHQTFHWFTFEQSRDWYKVSRVETFAISRIFSSIANVNTREIVVERPFAKVNTQKSVVARVSSFNFRHFLSKHPTLQKIRKDDEED